MNAVEQAESRQQAAFRPVVAPRVSDEVIDQICHAIHTGVFQVGDRLPRIDDLASITQVSGASASEAVRILVKAGVLTAKRGPSGGILVASSVIPADILKPSRPVARGMRELVEARRPIELELSRLAALRAVDEDFAEMRAAIAVQEDSIDDLESWSFANFRFHYAVGRAARSELLFHLQTEVTKELAGLLHDWTPRDKAQPRATIVEHAQILASLRDRDLDAVREAVDRHLAELEALIAT